MTGLQLALQALVITATYGILMFLLWLYGRESHMPVQRLPRYAASVWLAQHQSCHYVRGRWGEGFCNDTPVTGVYVVELQPFGNATVMAKTEAERSIILSTDEARAGITGQHVRYVLALGLAGTLIAFIAIVLYFGHGRLTETLAGLFAVPGTRAERLLLYAIPLALAAVATVLLLGLWSMAWGRSASVSQNLMRWRVIMQFIALCLVIAALSLSVR